MYWDVLEVTPEPDYCLLVRFTDGLTGRVRFEPEELVGALTPLRDVEFFNRVYVDLGAVTWPGEIDVAPDAMRDDKRRSSGKNGVRTGSLTGRYTELWRARQAL